MFKRLEENRALMVSGGALVLYGLVAISLWIYDGYLGVWGRFSQIGLSVFGVAAIIWARYRLERKKGNASE